MVDKVTLSTLVVIAASKLVAQAGATPVVNTPGLGEMANMTALSALIFLVLWMTTRTLPAIVKDFRDEMREVREDRDKERDRVQCRHKDD